MKVLLCERSKLGHRMIYLHWLTKMKDVEFFSYAPENTGLDEEHFMKYKLKDNQSLREYMKWIRHIADIVKRNKIDVVHFLDGDSIMKFFGFGFAGIHAKKIVITYHHLFDGLIRKISYRCMLCKKRYVSVVHTKPVKKALKNKGIKNVEVCEYPAFEYSRLAARNVEECKTFWNLPKHIPTIGIIGGMNSYKNILPFLDVMKNCKEDFRILICGKEGDISKEDLITSVAEYSDKVVMVIRMLSEKEYESAIVASDIIFCIYGHEFNGASGPVTDGVCAGKRILGCSHGSIGELVASNELGLRAECTEPEQMLMITEQALKENSIFEYGDKANSFRENLRPEKFLEKYFKVYQNMK